MRGRPPKPIEQRIREGNAGKRALPAPIDLGRGEIEKPSDLGPAGSELWDDLVPILTQANVLNRVDRAALMTLCIQWERAAQARKVLDKQGLFALGSSGQMIEHPAVQIERSAHQMFVRFAEQFGITPVARARIASAAAVAGATMRNEVAASIGLDLELPAVDEDEEATG